MSLPVYRTGETDLRLTSIGQITVSDLDCFFDHYPAYRSQLTQNRQLPPRQMAIMRDFLLDESRMSSQASSTRLLSHVLKCLEL